MFAFKSNRNNSTTRDTKKVTKHLSQGAKCKFPIVFNMSLCFSKTYCNRKQTDYNRKQMASSGNKLLYEIPNIRKTLPISQITSIY